MVEIIEPNNCFDDKVTINPEGFLFEIKCLKCSSTDIVLAGEDNIRTGSEYTGTYGDADLVIKCKTCGNAYSISVVER